MENKSMKGKIDCIYGETMTELTCSKCNYPIEEPTSTQIIHCPNCQTELLVPSRNLWNDFKNLTLRS